MGVPYRDSMPFTIRDVLDNLGLPVKAERRGSLILDCPFCLGKNGQPDHHGHMEIDLSRDRYRCHRCGRMGGKLDLYMEGHPNVMDTKQAYREMMEYLEGPRKRAPRFSPKVFLPPSLETDKRVSPEQLHKTYSALLDALTLTSTHRQNLRKRGLDDGEIDRLGYRSVPTVGQRRLASELMKAGYSLEGVPGFYLDERDRWTLYTWRSGIIMPERDSTGRILGLQVRKDQVEKHKCYWITGAKQKLGTPHTCGLHFARPQAVHTSGAAYLTEGIMKADIAAHFSDRCFLAVPGVSHYSAVRNALPACRKLGIHTVLMAFDMDMYENPAVANCFQTIRNILQQDGFTVKQISWDRSFKGIDDYLKGQLVRPKENREENQNGL